jgi:ABC-type proline/glycine betaine transport system permease subunit
MGNKFVAKPRKTAESKALHQWATAGVWLTLGMSALLNGYANSQNAPMAWAGWMMGAATPSLVLILSKVASLQWRKRRYSTARFTAGVGIGLLALSVWHCANAIAALTSSHLCLALPIAVAVDCGLVACELATLEGCNHV